MKPFYVIFWLSFGLVFVLAANYLDKLLVPYLEKSSFVWEVFRKKELPQEEIDLLVLGDSQILNGIHPNLLTELVHKRNRTLKFFYNPKPSEQLEGIYFFLLKYVATQKLKTKLVLWNLSPIHVTKNDFKEANKKLFLERGGWDVELLLNPILRNFYFSKEVDFLRYALNRLLPYQNISSLMNTELGLIPESLNLNLQSKNLYDYLSHDPIESLEKNKWQNNLILRSIQENLGYVDWNIEKNLENKECFVSDFRVPKEARFAYSIYTESSFKTLKKMIELLHRLNLDYKILIIPFSPSSEEVFQNFIESAPFQQVLRNLQKEFLDRNLLFVSLQEEEYGDYVHPNFCGAKKITQFIVEEVLLKE